jgi:uncharacterized repeat protein (TIGR03803 family)
LYGTTRGGGNNDSGTVFKITPGGSLASLYFFCAQAGCADGLNPWGLMQSASGDLYGTTYLGGEGGLGTIFKITASGELTTVHSFCKERGKCPDGANPLAGLVVGSDGNLWGSTAAGGPSGQGTIFKISPDGMLSTVYGAAATTLVQDTDGDFFGTTGAGGSYGYGTVFRLSAGLPPFVKILRAYGHPGETVKILGTALNSATSVTFGATAAVFQVASSSEITATIPAGASGGKVEVVTPGGILSSSLPFLVLP